MGELRSSRAAGLRLRREAFEIAGFGEQRGRERVGGNIRSRACAGSDLVLVLGEFHDQIRRRFPVAPGERERVCWPSRKERIEQEVRASEAEAVSRNS